MRNMVKKVDGHLEVEGSDIRIPISDLQVDKFVLVKVADSALPSATLALRALYQRDKLSCLHESGIDGTSDILVAQANDLIQDIGSLLVLEHSAYQATGGQVPIWFESPGMQSAYGELVKNLSSLSLLVRRLGSSMETGKAVSVFDVPGFIAQNEDVRTSISEILQRSDHRNSEWNN